MSIRKPTIHSIPLHYPMMEVQDYVIMPEHMHFIIKAHHHIISKNGRTMNLGQVIAGYKKGCNKRYWEMIGQQAPAVTRPGEPAATRPGEPAATRPGEPVGTLCSAVHPQKKRTPSCGATGRQPLFSNGYTDVIPLNEEQLQQKREYIRANPRSRLLRSSNRAWLQTQRGGIDTALTLPALKGYLQRECAPSQLTPDTLAALQCRLLLADGHIACDSYGNRELLSRQCLPVVCHRKYARRLEEQKQSCLHAAEQGAVLVSARIAKGEQEIIDEAVNHGYPVILIADNGFLEIYHPSTERIERCATGQMLYVSPWTYRYRLKGEGITVVECKTMNCVAQALCRTKDSWWLKE